MYQDRELGVVFHHGVLTRSVFVLRLIQLLTLAFSAAYALLLTRFVVEYTAAPPVPFVEWIRMITDRVYLPLRAFIATGHDRAGHPIAWALLAALGATAIAHLLVTSSLRRMARPRLEDDDEI